MKLSDLQDKSFWGFKYAFKGLGYAICTERHLRFHICAVLGTLMFTEYYSFGLREYFFLTLTYTLVIICELINTAIENIVDLCTGEYNHKAQIAKDVSAGFVLVSAIFALFVAVMLFLNKDLLANLADTFTKAKYIVYHIATILFIRGRKNGK